jgi:hypothetical protein
MNINMSINSKMPRAIDLGYVSISKAVSDMMSSSELNIAVYLNRHISRDWSEMNELERLANIDAADCGDIILSAYKLPQGCLDYIEKKYGEIISDKIYLETQADRSFTLIKLPLEN